MKIAKIKKCNFVELNCWNFNKNAIEFYEKCEMKTQRNIMEIKVDIQVKSKLGVKMKILKTIISSLKHTKLLILIFFALSVVLNYLVTYIPVIIQYFIDVLLNQNVNNRYN